MKVRISSAKALILYGIVAGFGLVFFLAGLFISREHLQVGEPVTEMPIGPAGSIVDGPQLDFYEELTEPPAAEGGSDEGETPDAPPKAARETEPEPRPEPEPPAASVGQFTIQVGALSQRKEASQMLIRLKAKGYDGRLQLPDAGGDDFYRVWVGEFSDWDQAHAVENQLKEDGFLTYLRKINP